MKAQPDQQLMMVGISHFSAFPLMTDKNGGGGGTSMYICAPTQPYKYFADIKFRQFRSLFYSVLHPTLLAREQSWWCTHWANILSAQLVAAVIRKRWKSPRHWSFLRFEWLSFYISSYLCIFFFSRCNTLQIDASSPIHKSHPFKSLWLIWAQSRAYEIAAI